MQGTQVLSLARGLDPTGHSEDQGPWVLQLRPSAAKYMNNIFKKERKGSNEEFLNEWRYEALCFLSNYSFDQGYWWEIRWYLKCQ